MKKFIPIAVVLTLLLTAKLSHANDFTIAPPSSWVTNYSYIESTQEDVGYGVVFLLHETQQNIPKQEFFMRRVVKPTNSTGLEHFSVIEVPFEPTSQHLVFHSLTIKRGETIIDLLRADRIVIMPEETNPERRALNNYMVANIYLNDLRINDVLEYSVTRVGSIPYYQGYSHREYNLQYILPMERIIVRVLNAANKNFNYKLAGGAAEPQITNQSNLVEYLWDVNANDNIVMEENTPAWYNPYRRISLSTYQNWSNVVEWLLPQFRYSKNRMRDIDLNLPDNMSKDDKILNIIRFVQDEVQNYTWTDGFVARAPKSPEVTYERRIGDSRDKSLLLIALLEREGVQAYPLFASATKQYEMAGCVPGYADFDRCAVYILHNNQEIFIDPTLQNQGGTIYNTHFPDYKYGLLIKNEQHDLTKLPAPRKGKKDFKTDIYFSNDLNSARMNIQVTYSNWLADQMRQWFSETQKETIERAYLDHYYGLVFPEITTYHQIRILDNSRHQTNELMVVVSYDIKNLWATEGKKSEKEFTFYSMPITTQLWFSGLSARTMPYDLGLPSIITDKVEFHMPERWPVTAFSENFENKLFDYSIKFDGNNQQVYLNYKYETHKSFIEASDAETFMRLHDHIYEDNTAVVLTHGKDRPGFTPPKNLKVILFIVLGIIAVVAGLMRNQY